MFRIKVDRACGLIEFALVGVIKGEETQQFAHELLAAVRSLAGREIRVKADVHAFQPARPEIAARIRAVQEETLRLGAVRVAEIVESEAVAAQINQLAAASGGDHRLRRFADEEDARDWLLHGERPLLAEGLMV